MADDDLWFSDVIFNTEPKDFSGAECRICGYPFGALSSACPSCGNSLLPAPDEPDMNPEDSAPGGR